jgi:hypothetical protein
LTDEENVNRVIENFKRLAQFMSRTAGFVVEGSIELAGKHLLRLLQIIRNEHGESWQVTEGLDLITDEKDLEKAAKKYGGYDFPTQRYFLKRYLPKDIMPPHEKELTTRALAVLFSIFDSRVMRATLGYFKAMWSPKWATEYGQMVIFDAHKMINQPFAQHYLITQAFSLVMAWINKREVDDPNNERVIIVLDETYALLKIDGFAEWLAMISPLYRSRGVELIVIIQGFWQLGDVLKEQAFSMGTTIFFRRDDNFESQIISRQLWNYNPHYVKSPARTDWQNPTIESEDGQVRMAADWIQNLPPRAFVMRQYVTEQEKYPGVIFIPRTTDLPTTKQYLTVREIKDRLIKEHGIPIRDALEIIKHRDLGPDEDNSKSDLKAPRK